MKNSPEIQHLINKYARCRWCKNPAMEYEDFRDAVSRKEARRSGLCQECQDKLTEDK